MMAMVASSSGSGSGDSLGRPGSRGSSQQLEPIMRAPRSQRRRRGRPGSASGLDGTHRMPPSSLLEMEEGARRQLGQASRLATRSRELHLQVQDAQGRLEMTADELRVLRARLGAYSKFFRFSVSEAEVDASLASCEHCLKQLQVAATTSSSAESLISSDTHSALPRSPAGSQVSSLISRAMQFTEKLRRGAATMQTCEQAVSELLRATHCTIFLVTGDGQRLRAQTWPGLKPRFGAAESGAAWEIPLTASAIQSECITMGAPVRTGQLYASERYRASATVDARRGTRTRSSLCVPLQLAETTAEATAPQAQQHRVVGVLEVINRVPGDSLTGDFDDEDETLLQVIAGDIAAMLLPGIPTGDDPADSRTVRVLQRWTKSAMLALGAAQTSANQRILDLQEQVDVEKAAQITAKDGACQAEAVVERAIGTVSELQQLVELMTADRDTLKQCIVQQHEDLQKAQEVASQALDAMASRPPPEETQAMAAMRQELAELKVKYATLEEQHDASAAALESMTHKHKALQAEQQQQGRFTKTNERQETQETQELEVVVAQSHLKEEIASAATEAKVERDVVAARVKEQKQAEGTSAPVEMEAATPAPEPVPEPAPAAEKEPATEEEPAAEKEPAADEEPAVEEEPAAEEAPATEQERAAEEPATEEEPSTEQEPAAEEEPPTEPELMPKVEPEPEPEPEPAPAEEEPATEEEPAAAERAEQQQVIDVAKEAAAELQKELSSLSHMLSPEEAAALQEELSDLQRATEQVEATDGSAMIKSVAADFLGMLVTNGIDSALAEGTTK